MALSGLVFSPNGQVLMHPSGRSYTPNSLNLCTIPVTDLLTWSSGGQKSVPGPSGPPASTIFPGQRLMSSVIGAAVFLGFTGATADRWVANSSAQGFEAPALGTHFYDTSLSAWVIYVGAGLGTTSFVDHTGAFV
jgi:hypothetical protein